MASLNDPIRIGDLDLPNRVLMSPLTRARATVDRVPTHLMLEYYVQRASAGFIISEATCISPLSVGYERTPGIWSAEQVAGWRRITEAVHHAGGRIFLQLWHVGRISHPILLNGETPVAPSAIAPDGRVYLSTAPYLSFAGAHLPRLKIPVPLHLFFGRRIAFATFVWLARHATWLLKEPANENSFIKLARKGEIKHDDLLELVTVSRLRSQIAAAGLSIVREELHATATIRRLPAFVGHALKENGLARDIFISNMEYVLAHAGSGTDARP